MQRKKKYSRIKQKAEATQAAVPKSKTITEPNHHSTPPTKKKAQDGSYAKPDRNQRKTILYLCIQNTMERLILLCK